jgi:argininosuccinate synthase
MKTIVLAYSGGLDTSIIVPWLREKYDARVICVAADIGQGPDELAGVRAKALASGAEECYVEDLRDEFVRDFIFPPCEPARSTIASTCWALRWRAR